MVCLGKVKYSIIQNMGHIPSQIHNLENLKVISLIGGSEVKVIINKIIIFFHLRTIYITLI